MPPADTYDVTSVLPFGWEEAVDSNGLSYFIKYAFLILPHFFLCSALLRRAHQCFNKH